MKSGPEKAKTRVEPGFLFQLCPGWTCSMCTLVMRRGKMLQRTNSSPETAIT